MGIVCEVVNDVIGILVMVEGVIITLGRSDVTASWVDTPEGDTAVYYIEIRLLSVVTVLLPVPLEWLFLWL